MTQETEVAAVEPEVTPAEVDPQVTEEEAASPPADPRKAGREAALESARKQRPATTPPVEVGSDDQPENPEAAPGSPPEEGVDPPAAEGSRGIHVVELPEDHPVREGMPVSKITVGTPEEERALRTLINSTGIRRREADRIGQQYAELQQSHRELQEKIARQEAEQVAEEEWKGTPDYEQFMETYQELVDGGNEAAAERLKLGYLREKEEITKREFDKRLGALDEQDDERSKVEWRETMWGRVASLPVPIAKDPQMRAIFEQEVENFDLQMKRGLYPEVKTVDQLNAAFSQTFVNRIKKEPAFQQALLAAQQKQTPREAAPGSPPGAPPPTPPNAARQGEPPAPPAPNVRETSPPNPLASLPHTSSSPQTTETPVQEIQADSSNPFALRKEARERAMAAARARSPTQ